MRKLFGILLLISLNSIAQNNGIVIKRKVFTNTASVSSFTYTLDTASTVSAGIYNSSNVLVRTLFSGVSKPAGTYPVYWDNLNDDSTTASAATYTAKVVSNNVKYDWLGLIGNTSTDKIGSSRYHNSERMYDMTVVGTTAYYCTRYNEQATNIGSTWKFSTSDIGHTTNIAGQSGQSSFLCSDGTYVYWATQDPTVQLRAFVFATKVSDDTEVNFNSGSSISLATGSSHSSTLDYSYADNNYMTGIAVQPSGKYLFVSHGSLNEIHVFDVGSIVSGKPSGALVQTITTFTNPRRLACDSLGNLWVISATNTVAKYSVNSSTGALTSLSLAISGLVDPNAITCKGTSVIIADRGTSQQIKSFNWTTGASNWTYGTAGGYASDPTVSNSKFYFNDARQSLQTFVAVQADNSFWVGDAGNSRSQHYDSARTFLNRIMYLPQSYDTRVDPNSTTRVFSDYMEFSISYPDPTTSWTLVKNWGYNVTSDYDVDNLKKLNYLTTLSNSKTYAFEYKGSTSNYEVVELPASGNLRFTGVTVPIDNQMYPDGSLRKTDVFGTNGQSVTWSKKTLTGFDGSSNPTWGSSSTISSIPSTNNNDPLFWGNYGTLRAGEITSSNVLASFDGGTPPYTSSLYHIGGINVGGSGFFFKGAKVTNARYIGPYPSDGAYDIGNGVQYAGSIALAIDRNIFWGYHGEFWKAAQTNKYTHLLDNGLLIKTFGVTPKDSTSPDMVPGMAGNAISTNIIKNGSDYYIFHNDESYFGGVHVWKVSNLASIKEFALSPTLGTETLAGTDLMAGLTRNAVLTNGNGWTRNPTSEDSTNLLQNWYVQTNKESYTTPDVYMKFRQASGTYTVIRDLGSNTGLTNWKVTGNLSWDLNYANQGTGGGSYIEVLDNADKIIARLSYETTTYPLNAIQANGTNIKEANGDGYFKPRFTIFQPVEISATSGTSITFKFGSETPVTVSKFDGTSAWNNPTKLRFYFYASSQNYDRIIDVKDLRFIATP